MDDKQKKLIEESLSLLAQADTDHWCDSKECSIDTPCCSAMYNRAAARSLRAIIDPEMTSLHPNRLTNPAERVYFDRWKRENERHSAVNGSHTALELILCPPEKQATDFTGRCDAPRPSQRDAEVATAIIQWLGTNCGHAFVLECEKQIGEERAERSEMFLLSDRFTESHRRDLFQRMMNAVLKDVLPSPARGAKKWATDAWGLAHLRGEISRAMRTVFTLYAFGSGKASAEDCAKSLGMGLTEFRRLNEHAEKATDDAVSRLKTKSKATA
jgi:hypothetical protein